MWEEWLDITLKVFLTALFVIAGLLVFVLFGLLWYMISKVSMVVAIILLVLFVGIPLGTFIYTIYKNRHAVADYFEELKYKLKGTK